MSTITPIKKLNKSTTKGTKQKNLNDDVIKACESIMKKANNPDMRSMAR